MTSAASAVFRAYLQDDFRSLEIVEPVEDAAILRDADRDNLTAPKQSRTEDYVPTNDIDPEIFALLAAWEAYCLDHPQSSASTPVYEPYRPLSSSDPPKRFYRTFWRGITKRLIKSQKCEEASKVAS